VETKRTASRKSRPQHAEREARESGQLPGSRARPLSVVGINKRIEKIMTSTTNGRVSWIVGVSAMLAILMAFPVTTARADGGLVRTAFPSSEDPGPPLYARVGEPTGPVIYNDGEWALVVFYREPDCVPASFNLLDFFAFDAFGCEMTVSGFSLWEVEVGTAPPKVLRTTGTDVPIWFLPLDVATQATADGVLTISELESLPGLLVGHADRFSEVLHPIPLPPQFGGGGHPSPKLIQNAKGWLEDGRRFTVHISRVEPDIKAISIDFG